MVYEQRPDWSSLCSVRLGRDIQLSLGEVAEGLRRCRQDDVDIRLAPGEAGPPFDATVSLTSAMSWTAAVVVSGSLGNAGYDLIKQLLAG